MLSGIKIIDCEQGSEEWIEARLGLVTASRFSDVLAKGQGITRKKYMIELAAERLTGLPQDSFSNSAMEWGTEHEAEAGKLYAAVNDCEIFRVGFFGGEWVGASPDFLVGDEGEVEIKCPNTTTHITNILANKMPTTYNAQVQGQMWITGRKWCDFVSYDPRLIARPILIIRVERNESYITNLAAQVDIFIEELKELIAKIRKF